MSQSPYPAIAAGPPRPSLILRPGQIALPPGMERYTVQGNGAVLIEIEAGDMITVRNVEGGQACELLAWDKTGATDPGIFGETSNCNAAGIKALLAEGDDSLASLRRGFARRQVQLDQAKAVRVFGSATPAGT
ncbi:MAG: aminomethyltransferase, partial [Mesorhizobium sp.]